MLVKRLQLRKAESPMLVTLVPIEALVMLLHPLKALYPMLLVTLFGIVMLVKLVQP
jgi:hypothetical protein